MSLADEYVDRLLSRNLPFAGYTHRRQHMFFGDSTVIVQGIVIWDGITRPEPLTGDNGKPDGMKYSCKLAIPNNAPEIAELDQILRTELTNGQFRGALPNGALWGISDISPNELGGLLPAHKCINAVSYHQVQVFGTDNKELPGIAYQNMLYPGAVVRMIVTARSYNNKSKGLGFWLSGIQIVDATAPRLPVGSGVNAAAAFAAAPALPMVGAPPAGAAPGLPVYQAPPPIPPNAPGLPPVQPAPAAFTPPPVYQAPPVPGPGPAPDFLNPGVPPAPVAPPQPQMTAAANGVTYQQYIAAGWTEAQMRQAGLLV